MDDNAEDAPLARGADGVMVVEGDAVGGRLDRLPPVRRMVFLILLLALRDRATSLRFEPWDDAAVGPMLRLSYEVDGRWHELEPPHGHLAGAVADEFRHFAGLDAPGAGRAGAPRSAASGRFRIRLGGEAIDVAAAFHPAAAGERIDLRFPDGGLLAGAAERACRAAADGRRRRS